MSVLTKEEQDFMDQTRYDGDGRTMIFRAMVSRLKAEVARLTRELDQQKTSEPPPAFVPHATGFDGHSPSPCVCGSLIWNSGGLLGAHCAKCNRDLVWCCDPRQA